MQGQAYAQWEVRSAILSGWADALITISHDGVVALTDAERAALVSVAEKLIAEARAVVRKG